MTAVFSQDRTLRYELRRRVDLMSDRVVLFVMLNPSTADETQDDPTIRRCIGFAQTWGYGFLWVGNLYAYRATDPKELRRWLGGRPPWYARPLAYSLNLDCLQGMATKANLVVAAWGNGGAPHRVGFAMELAFRQWEVNAHHLGLTKTGQPRHPLYVPKTQEPVRWQ